MVNHLELCFLATHTFWEVVDTGLTNLGGNPSKLNGIFHKNDTVKAEWSIVYFDGSRVIVLKK